MKVMCQGSSVRVVVILCCVSAILCDGYYIRYLNVTANALLNNKRLMGRYVSCLAGEGPCPPQAREIKKLMPELMTSECSRCDVMLRQVFEKCRQMLQSTYPKRWPAMFKPTRPSPNSL